MHDVHMTNSPTCFSSDCGRESTGTTPLRMIRLGGTGDAPTCDRCHKIYTGQRREKKEN